MNVVLLIGQSQSELLSVQTNAVQDQIIPGAGFAWHSGAFGAPVNTEVNFVNRWFNKKKEPCLLANLSVGGSSLQLTPPRPGGSWSDTSPGSPLSECLTAIAAILALGHSISCFSFTHVETDAEAGIGATVDNYAAALLLLCDRIRAAAGNPNLSFIVTQAGSVATDSQWATQYPSAPNILAAQRRVTSYPNVFLGPEYFDLPYLTNLPSIHLSEVGYKMLSDRLVDRLLEVVGLVTTSIPASEPPAGEHFWGNAGAHIIPSNDGRDVSCNLGNWSDVRGDTPITSAVGWGIELVSLADPSRVLLGAVNSTHPIVDGSYPGLSPKGCGLRSNNQGGPFVNGVSSVIGQSFTFAPGDQLFFYIQSGEIFVSQNGGAWVKWCTGLTGSWYPAVSINNDTNANNKVRLISDAASLAGVFPSGVGAYGVLP